MLYRAFLTGLLSLCFATGVMAQVQSSVLTRNAKGRYFFTHISNAAGVPKVVLYERMKQFAADVLDASDNYMKGDESGNDSLSTLVYVTLENGPEMMNQVVDFKVRMTFIDGMVILKARDFMYRGRRVTDDVELSSPLYKLDELTPTAQTAALAAFDETLRLLMVQMDKRAVGK